MWQLYSTVSTYTRRPRSCTSPLVLEEWGVRIVHRALCPAENLQPWQCSWLNKRRELGPASRQYGGVRCCAITKSVNITNLTNQSQWKLNLLFSELFSLVEENVFDSGGEQHWTDQISSVSSEILWKQWIICCIWDQVWTNGNNWYWF